MSLDNRLRQGLRTLEGPESDPASELERFRKTAYPRRARRRVFHAVVGTIAAAALIAGVTTAVTNSARKAPGFITPIPSNVPACRSGDVQLVTGYRGPGEFSLGVFSTKSACRIDETFAPIVTSNAVPFEATASVHQLAVRGDGSPERLQGIVPSESDNALLTIAWTWTNWCGPDRSFTLSFHWISGNTNILKGESGNSGTFPTVPSCKDASKPSIMSAGPTTLTPRVTASSSSSGPVYDKNPHIITPRPGLTNLVLSPINQVLVRPDGKTLIVSFTHSVGCRLFARIDVKQDASGVTIGVYVGDVPGAQSSCVGEVVDGDAAMVVLEQPLGNRPIYDARYPGNLGVLVYHVKG